MDKNEKLKQEERKSSSDLRKCFDIRDLPEQYKQGDDPKYWIMKAQQDDFDFKTIFIR